MARKNGTWWRRNWKWLVPVGCFTFILLGAGVVVGVGVLIYRYHTSPSTHLDFDLPPSAKVLQQKIGSSDHFGDYSYYLAFQVSEPDLKALCERDFWWMTLTRPDGRPAHYTAPPAKWRRGPLPDDVVHFMKQLAVYTEDGPRESVSYRYLFREVDGGWWRLLVVDEQRKTVYYYRVTY